MTIKVKILPPIRDQFTMAAMERHLAKELLNYWGSEIGARIMREDYVRKHQPVNHDWDTAMDRARHIVYKELLPSERRLMTETVSFE